MQYTLYHSDKIDVSFQTLTDSCLSGYHPVNFGWIHYENHSSLFACLRLIGGFKIQINRQIPVPTNKFEFKLFTG